MQMPTAVFSFYRPKCAHFAVFEDFGVSMDTLDKMRETFPDNKNIEYLCRLRERIPACHLQDTYVYVFCGCLYRKLRPLRFDGIKDITAYASISEWIYNINPEWNVSAGFFSGRSLEQVGKIDAGVHFYADVSLLLREQREIYGICGTKS